MYSRRKLITLVLLFAAVLSPAVAQIPRTISFQGVLADAQGVLVPDGNTDLTVAIYDVPAGGAALFSETLTATVVRGVFNAVIGSTNPTGIPTSVSFDKQYWLGVRVGTGAELAPRTPFTSVPYALNAAFAQSALTAITADSADWSMTAVNADTAGTVRGGYVLSINGQQGAVEILGAGATTVTRNGSQFIIRSTDTSSGGIRRIDNFDGSLVIDPPQGPFVTMFIREQGVQTHHIRDLSITTAKIIDLNVTTPKLANNAVTAAKVNTEGAPDGYALISNGTITPGWENPLTANIPYAETFDSPLTLWDLTNVGTGGVGRFVISNPASSATALLGATDGTGNAILGEHWATTGTAAAVHGWTNSTDANATAVMGVVGSTSPGGFSSAVRGANNGTGGLGIGVYGSQGGSGWGVYGTTPSGIGVHGSSSSGFGIYGLSSTGIGVYGNSNTGTAGQFDITNNASTATSLVATTNGTGDAFRATNSGATGRAALLEVTNVASPTNAVDVSTAGTGWALTGRRGASSIFTGNGGILGESTTGPGVAGFSNSSTGIIGASVTGNGMEGVAFGPGATAVLGTAIGAGGIAIRGTSSSGTAGRFDALSGSALDAVIINNDGTGRSLSINQTNVANTLPAFSATSAGSGPTIQATNTGLGSGLQVLLTNAGSGARGIDVAHSGVGTGVFATSAGGMGLWGITSSISAAGVIGDNTFGEAVVGRNRGGVGVGAVVGRNDSSGYGVRGFNTKDGIGVLGQAGISGGTGVAGRFENVNAANTSTTLQVSTNGIGNGITVQLSNAANGARGIDVTQSGVGPGVFSTSAGGNAVWGITSSISAAGVIGDNTFGEAVVGRNRGGNGVGAVVGRNDSSGYGVRGFNTKDGIGVLGQAGISGGTGVGGRFENVNAANGNDALQAATNGTGWAGNFANTNNSSAARGVRISTTAGQGGNGLTVANGTVSFSSQNPYASNTVVDDAVLVVTAGGAFTVPTGPPLVNGATVWVVNNSGVLITLTNTTIGGFNIAPGAASQFLFVSSVSGANWIPVQ